MKILVTGGAGFVGSHLALLLKRDQPQARVIALDNLKRRGSELNLPRLRAGGVEFVHGDVRQREDLAGVGGFDLLLECSAEPSVMAGIHEAPDYVINTNLVGTINCLEETRKHKAGMIFLSTSRVYPIKTINRLHFIETETRFELAPEQAVAGVSPRGIAESFPLDAARSLYGTTKLASELLLLEYLDMYGIRGIINRCGVLTGPWQMGKIDQGVMVLWVARHIYQGKLAYFGFGGHGKQVRDVLHVNDLYRLVKIQIERLTEFNGQVFNAGGGREISVSLCELTKLCQEATGLKIPIGSVPANREADIPYYITDNAKVTAATGWKPETGVKEIVSELAAWIREHQVQLQPILS